MKILQILPFLKSGGVERGTLEISQAIINAGHESFVVSAGGALMYNVEKQGAKHFVLPVNRKNPFVIFKTAKKLRKIIKENNIDIVHARSRVPAWIAYFALKNTKVKFLTTFHGVYSGKSKLKKAYNKVMLRGEKIIAVSEFIKNHIKENYGFKDMKKVKVIHRGVDLSHFDKKLVRIDAVHEYIQKWNLPDDKKIILMPGRLTDWKGQHYFIEALSKLERDDFYGLIVGSSMGHESYKKKLEALIQEKGLEGKVSIYENVADLLNLYQLSDFIVSASLRPEAFGRIMVEVGAMEKVILATNHGGAMETVIDGKTGFLGDYDNVHNFADKIHKILNLSLMQKEQIGKEAKKYVSENFTISLMQKKTIEIYEKLVKGENGK